MHLEFTLKVLYKNKVIIIFIVSFNIWDHFLKKILIVLFSKDALNWSKNYIKDVFMLQNISKSNICFFELSNHQRIMKIVSLFPH